MGVLQRIAGAFVARAEPAPKQAHKFSTRELRALFDVAQDDPDNRKHWGQADYLAADASLTADVRNKLRSRSRYEIENNSFARHIAHTTVQLIVGTGPRLRVIDQDVTREQAKLINRAWRRFDRRVNLTQLIWTARLAQLASGEVLIYMAPALDVSGTMSNLDLHLIEADQLHAPATPGTDAVLTTESADQTRNHDGVIVNRWGKPLRYQVAPVHPGAEYTAVNSKHMELDASRVVHLFRRERPGQVRGIPELTASLPLFAEIRRYGKAVRIAAEVAALHTTVMETDAPPDVMDEGQDDYELDEIQLERGMATFVPAGWKLRQLQAEQPTTMYDAFVQAVVCEAAAAVHLPRNLALLNSSSYNYASGKLDHQAFGRYCESEQRALNTQLLDRVLAMWWESATESGELAGVGLPEPPEVRWDWDSITPGEPLKEAQAAQLRVALGQSTRAEEAARAGKDFEENMHQQASELALARELGVPLEGVPMPAMSDDADDQDGTQATEGQTDDD